MSNSWLIAVDLDGTLLRDKDKTISERNKAALHKAMDLGHKVVISTGRPYRSSKMYYQELNLDTPIVNFNGALVHHPRLKEWGLFHSPMELDIAKQVINLSETVGVQNLMVEVMDDVYLKKHDDQLIETFFGPSVTVNILPRDLHTDPTSVLIYPHDRNIDKLRDMIEANHAEAVEHRRWGAPWNVIEVIRKGLNKAEGLKKVSDSLGIPQQRIIAFGDEDNDLEMIEYAEVGVAMNNAIPELKKRATHTTLSNEEDGIAHFLERHFFE